MSVKQTVNFLSNQRADIPDLRSIESSAIFDFKTLLQCFIGDNPYILKGFTIPYQGIGGAATSLQLVVDGSIVWVPNDINGSFLKVASGTPNEVLSTSNSKVIGSFSPGLNYIGIQFTRSADPTTSDLVTLWDVDSQSEFTITAPRGLVLDYQIVISNSSFSNTAPVAIVTVSGSTVTAIENAKTGLFRLGLGGATPDPNNSFSYTTNPENPLTATSNGGPDPFAGGDWELQSMKNWMDAVMTEIKNIKGSAYWYGLSSTLVPSVNLSNLFFDSVGSVITGVGKFQHDNTTPGLLTWTSDIFIRSILGPLTFRVLSGNVTLSDGQVAYIPLLRNLDFQPSNTFTFINSNSSVTATLPVAGLLPGDWIKFSSDNIENWAQVQSIAGPNITLTAPYNGSTATGKALRSRGTYTMQTASPLSVPANADVFWLAKRDDNAVPASTIASPGSSGATRTSNVATITTTTPHNLVAGESISISGVSDPTFDGVFDITSVPTSTTITFDNPGADVGSGTVGNGSVSVRAKIYLRALGEIIQGEDRAIDDETIINLLKFVGSETETDTTPPYTILPNAL